MVTIILSAKLYIKREIKLTWFALERMPTWFAIAAAVTGWSPVTIITFIPADLHSLTAPGTLDFGGSIILIKPTNLNNKQNHKLLLI